MLNLIEKLKIVDSSNRSNIIDLDNIMSGVDGASTFGYSLTPTALQVNDGQRQQYKFSHQLDVRTLDPTSADREKLAVIEAGNIPVEVSGLTSDGFILFNGRLTRSDQYDEVIADRFLVTQDTVPGYDLPYAGVNLAASRSSWFVDGTISQTFYTAVTTNGVVDVTALGGGNVNLGIGTFVLPYAGQTLYFAANITARSITVAGAHQIGFTFFNAAGGTISSANQTITTTGITSVTATIPANTVRVFCQIFINPTTGGDTFSFTQPIIARSSRPFSL